MSLLRRLCLLAVVAGGFAVLSSPAFARDGSLPFHVDSQNFRVHFQSDVIALPNNAITYGQATGIAALAERALASETADGYQRPPSDGALGGDNRIDIYVEDYSLFPGVVGSANPDTGAATSPGSIDLAGNDPEDAFTEHTVAHELFHLIQFGMWIPAFESDAWLLEASAEWMGFRVDAYPAPDEVGPMDLPLDCRDPIDTEACDLDDDYVGGGYSRWPFFEYLSERFGTSFLTNVFAQGLAGAPTATDALATAFVAKGTTLADVYDDWASFDVRGAYTVASLQGRPPVPYGAPISTGTATATLPNRQVSVDHLSTRIVEFDRGGGSATGPCFAATLSLTVTIPAGTSSKPVFIWNMPGTSPVALSINGTTATASVPWDTCIWATGRGYLVLPNAGTTVDAADFTVKAAITVNTAVPATASDPPPGVILTTPAIPVSGSDPAPSLSVFGPQLVTLAAGVNQIRLIVQSNDGGTLQATLGSSNLGAQPLRIGSNDVRFTVPTGLLQTLRTSASASSMVLTLTPVSSSGNTGVAVTRTVSVVSPAAPAKKQATKPVKKSTKQSTKKSGKKPAKKPATTKKTGTK